MSNKERDIYLHNAMDVRYHDYEYGKYGNFICHTCNFETHEGDYELLYHKNINLSDWSGFGVLWEWTQQQDWFSHFMWKHDPLMKTIKCLSGPSMKIWNVKPDVFANAVYTFIKNEVNR